jgi:cold shock CspA family protein
MSGRVKYFNQERHFGFIGLEGGVDVFFHGSEVSGNALRCGDAVRFWLDGESVGLRAVEVHRIA